MKDGMTFDLSPGWISLKTVIAATVITFFLGLSAAYWMYRYHGRLKNFADTLFTLPLVLPPTVVGFFLLLFFGRNGPIGKLLLMFGTTLIFSWPATVLAATVVAFPLMYRTTKAAFEQLDDNIINAARILGVNESRIFWQVMIPMAWPGIAAATVLSFARALGEFGATLMVAGSIPHQTETIPLAIYFAAEDGNMRLALVWVLLIVVISALVLFLINNWSDHLQKNTSDVRRK